MNEVISAASAASTALPPARRISAPAEAVRGWPAATTPRSATPASHLEAWNEFRDVDVGRTRGALRLTLTRAGYPRLTRGLTEAAGRGRLAARGVVARGHDRHPHLVLELLVDHGAEDDVRVGMCGLLDLAGGLVDLPQRQ